jgi:AcrR family transcriptional regulator
VRKNGDGAPGPSTDLERLLDGPPAAPHVSPLDALRAARRHFVRGERVDMSELAIELGVGRATLYRWVGGRDQLLGEVLWSMAEPGLRRLRERATGDGVDWFMQIYSGFGEQIVANQALHAFVANEPEAALRVFTAKHSPMPRRVVEFYREVLDEGALNRGLALRLDTETLAYVLVRVAESFLWSDLMTGEQLDLSKAHTVARALLS